MLTAEQTRAIDSLRENGWGRRKIADELGIPVWSVRKHMEANPEPDSLAGLKNPRILLYDIETAPSLVWVWSQWKTNVIDTERDWYMLSFAYKWLGEDEIHFVSIFQDPKFKPDTTDDLYVAVRLKALFDEADQVVAHNGNSFDQKKANARFLYHGLGPASPYREIDTKLEARRYFKNYSNSLNEIARVHDLGRKVEHVGFRLWRECMRGDPEYWKIMEEYNRHDVELLESVYFMLLPWMGSPGKPGGVNYGFWSPGITRCPKCGSVDLKKNGTKGKHRSFVSEWQTFQCRNCGGYSRARLRESQKFDRGVRAV